MKSVIGKNNIIKNNPDILYDESKYKLGIPNKLFFPENKHELIEIIKDAHNKNNPITFIGGQTGISGGSVPVENCTAISFGKMNKIIASDNSGKQPVLYCQPGVTLNQISEFLKNPKQNDTNVFNLEAGKWFYPPDPTEMTAQLGGTVATNASGARSYSYGATRNHIVSLLIILPNGDSISLKRGEHIFTNDKCTITTDSNKFITIPLPDYSWNFRKNASGYYSKPNMDLIDLFIGSEGTLGCFAEIGISLSHVKNIISGLTFLPNRKSAFSFADFLRKQKRVTAIEYFDSTALNFIRKNKNLISLKIPEFPINCNTAILWDVEDNLISPFEDDLEIWDSYLSSLGTSFDNTWSGFDSVDREKLKTFRHALPELVNFVISQRKKDCNDIRKIGTDSAVNPENFEDIFNKTIAMINKENIEYVVFGHLGDFHLHFNLLPKNKKDLKTALTTYSKIMELAIQKNGTVSAEHGIGKIKTKYLEKMYGEKNMKEMKKIKLLLDQHMCFNPNTLFSLPIE